MPAVRVEKTCENCGALFLIKPSHAHQKFCGRACLRAYEKANGRPAAIVAAVEFRCKVCGDGFTYKPAYLTEYRKKFGKDPMYCSTICAGKGRRADTEAAAFFTCLQCGKNNPMRRYEGASRSVYYRQQKFCDVECKAAWQRAQAEVRFVDGKIGRHIKRNGYVWISIPANLNGGIKTEMLEHRWVMERHLGRKLLPDETVHHIDGNRQHNSIDNLELFSSRHGPGQRVIDKIAFAIEMLRLYPEFAREAGVELHDLPSR